jgi:hypothetical protein
MLDLRRALGVLLPNSVDDGFDEDVLEDGTASSPVGFEPNQ